MQQELASLTGKLRLAINQIAVAPDAAVATITGAQDDVRRTLGDVRSIAQGIHPAILDDQGIVPAIDARAKRLPLDVSLDVDPALAHRRFERRIEGAAYFLASEALANIVKHAEATEVTITLALQSDCLSLTISDNGRGLTPGGATGRGLTNMADRAAALGGSVSVRSDGVGGYDRDRRVAVGSYGCVVTLRVVIAEDNKVYREGVRAVLELDGQVEVVAAVDRADELLARVDELLPDAVVTDIRMPPTHQMEGIEAAHEIRRRHPGIGVLVLSQHADDSYAFELLKDGTAGLGYLLKERIGDDDGAITRAVHEVVAGRSVIDAEVVDALVARQTRARSSPVNRLTERERQVLGLMAQGRTNDAIAETLYLHRATVEKHINSIFTALDLSEEKQVNKRVAAVLLFLRDT